ncbi:MAG: hypothetical protein WCR27_04180 [Eubacteriales bacterium]
MQKKNNINFSNLIITLTTIIFATTSLITVMVSVTAWKEEREAVRPYLTINNSPIVELNSNLSFKFEFNNVGLHPAANLHSQTIITECTLNEEPLYTEQISLVNNIPQNTCSELLIQIDKSNIDINNYPPHYIIISLKYSDPIINKAHEQIIYLKWAGITNNKVQQIYHASIDDKNKIVEFLAKL